jgi:hypothetical protein
VDRAFHVGDDDSYGHTDQELEYRRGHAVRGDETDSVELGSPIGPKWAIWNPVSKAKKVAYHSVNISK